MQAAAARLAAAEAEVVAEADLRGRRRLGVRRRRADGQVEVEVGAPRRLPRAAASAVGGRLGLRRPREGEHRRGLQRRRGGRRERAVRPRVHAAGE